MQYRNRYPQKLFETGNVFSLNDPISEKINFSGISTHKDANFTEIKSILQSALKIGFGIDLDTKTSSDPLFEEGRCATVVIDGKHVGIIGELSSKVIENYKNVRFVVAGSGDMLEGLMMNSADKKFSKYIIFTGFIKRDEVNTLLATSDVYFMPSVSEPFGISPLESMRNDTPTIISKQSGVSEVVSHCLKVDFWDVNELSNKIISVLEQVWN